MIWKHQVFYNQTVGFFSMIIILFISRVFVCFFFFGFLTKQYQTLNCIIHLKHLFFTLTEPNYLKLCLKQTKIISTKCRLLKQFNIPSGAAIIVIKKK